jgi:hypothetical protein
VFRPYAVTPRVPFENPVRERFRLRPRVGSSVELPDAGIWNAIELGSAVPECWEELELEPGATKLDVEATVSSPTAFPLVLKRPGENAYTATALPSMTAVARATMAVTAIAFLRLRPSNHIAFVQGDVRGI